MIVYTPIILAQLQKYTLILKEQIMENFSVQYRGGIIWKSLPNDLKELKSSNAFKKALHTYVQSAKNTLIPWLICEVILIMPPFYCKEIIQEPLKSSSELAEFPFALTLYIIYFVITRLCTMYEGLQFINK